MDDAKVAAIRRWVVGICMLGAVGLIALGFVAFRNLERKLTGKRIDPEVFQRERRALKSDFDKDRAGTRQRTLTAMQKSPEHAADQLSYLFFAERDYLESLPPDKQQTEAEVALNTQLAAIKILESQNTGIEIDFSWDHALKIAILARRSELIREHAKDWSTAGGVGIFSDDAKRHDGYQYLGWADLIDGKIDAAAENLRRSGDFMSAPTLESFGPSTELADALLKKDRFADVTAWVQKVRGHWEPETCDAWLELLKKNQRPTDETWTGQFAY
jgi:hypothetical protein